MTYGSARQRFWCCSWRCGEEIPLRRHSFFAGRRLPTSKIMHLAYLWLKQDSVGSMQVATGQSKGHLASIIQDFRQLVNDAVDEEDVLIGGPGIVVEIDETKFGKRKYQRGHRVEGVWVLGGIERTPERRLFALTVPDRSAATLEAAITCHVRPGSIIYTDVWRGYNGLPRINGYQHYAVNYSETFRDPVTGVHTNTIEGTWAGIKRAIPPRCYTKNMADDHLWEFSWRRKNRARLWAAFLDALTDVHYE